VIALEYICGKTKSNLPQWPQIFTRRSIMGKVLLKKSKSKSKMKISHSVYKY